MALTEESRHHLYQALERTIGPDEAATLMEHLPPVGWADVATKRDVDQVHTLMKRDLEQVQAQAKRDLDAAEERIVGRVDVHIANWRSEFFREQRNQALALIGTNLTVGALVVAAIRLLP